MYVCAVVGDLSSPSDANYDASSSNPTKGDVVEISESESEGPSVLKAMPA